MMSMKSWWYWNVSTKWDSLDLFVFVFYPCLLALLIFVMFEEHQEKMAFATECSAKGGVVVKGNGLLCIDKSAIK